MEFLQNDQHIKHEHNFWTEISKNLFVAILINLFDGFDQVFEELSFGWHSDIFQFCFKESI